jgi:signal transduction histidine kinase
VELIPQNIKYINGAYWLIRLRWIAIVWVFIATFSAKYIFKVQVQDIAFCIVAIALSLENIISLKFLSVFKHLRFKERFQRLVSRIINCQISFDLLALATIIHFSGGIENPIFVCFIFHMVIASILLKKMDSYIQATIGLLMLWTLALIEYSGIINHYSLWVHRVAEYHLYLDKSYIIETLTIFTFTSYVLVYMTNFIVGLLRKQEEAYQQANKLLNQKDKIKDEYVSRVTHNIKGHLTVIQTNLAIIKDKTFGSVDEKQIEFIDNAYNRTSKLSFFVNDLLKLTQMRLNEKPEIEEFSLREVISNVVESASKNAEAKSLNLIHHIDDNVNNIISNRFSMEELITSLLFNAIKYTPENGVVELNVTDHKDTIQIEVSDTGIGIPEAELPLIFNEFYRASNAKELIKDGTGLGLAMAKYIVHRYSGDISVTSKSGIGTKFKVTFPKKITIIRERLF